jgi:hypothetical protein
MRNAVYRSLIVLLLGLSLGVTDAVACSCIQTMSALEAAEHTGIVFRARAITTVMVLINEDGTILYKNERESPTGYIQRFVALRVEEIFKGAVAPLTVLVTGSGAGDCGYAFEDGKEYLVFAEISSEKRLKTLAQSNRVLTTSICSFTQPTEGQTDLLAALGKKYPSKQPLWMVWE